MRKAGVLLPISSLASRHGIGTLGKTAYSFIDFLAEAGQSYWQVLPVGPTGFGDSPYQSFSAFAGNPYLIDLPLLVQQGLLLHQEIGTEWGEVPSKVEYGLLFKKRFAVLAKAAARQNKADPAYRAFCEAHASWLDDYALYMAIKEAHGQVGLQHWPAPLRTRQPAALQQAAVQYAPRAEFWRCLQYFFFTQWQNLKTYANQNGVELVGDIPIYVSDDSSDLWANPGLFQTDQNGHLSVVAGVPPDAFSADGQLWGNPLYNWPAHKRTGYAWWMRRLAHSAALFDVSRIDHFRGFCDYYAIPAGAKNARVGEWRPGPGKDFIRALHKKLPAMQIIAEDLGFLTPEVHELLAFSGYPGMKILQFAFDSRDDSDYLPHNYHHHTVAYTGTHDNTTTQDWQYTAPKANVAFCRRYLGLTPHQNLTESLVRATLASVAQTAIIPLQDWLHLGADARINTPSTLGGNNWRWRLVPGQLPQALATHMRQQTALYGRLSAAQRAKVTAKTQQKELQTALTTAEKAGQ
ncbi:4-alpha-glucanotransferase [Ruminococcaceae bacterium OttesenSCG-928-A16]|nr:4-alpha-glucanotransferase [Ruminococcaceae bacterium OttesenSCG-928-A16]